jgi:osmotically-inducible protein OsmY
MAWIKQRESRIVVPTDREVRSTVVHRLRENPYTQDSHIKVTVSDGVVELDGSVENAAARETAADDAWVVPGVSEVHNELVVDRAA